MTEKKERQKKGFDFSSVRNTPSVRAAEKEIMEGFENLNKEEETVSSKSEGERVGDAVQAIPDVPVAEKKSPVNAQVQVPQGVPASVAVAPGEPTQNINVAIPISLHSRLAIIKATTRQNMKDLVVLAIKEYVERYDARSK